MEFQNQWTSFVICYCGSIFPLSDAFPSVYGFSFPSRSIPGERGGVAVLRRMSHSSPKLAAADSPSREQRIVNSHFFSPGPAETALWEKGLEHRRLVSNDPHVNLRVEQSRQFDNTPFQKIFDHMQVFECLWCCMAGGAGRCLPRGRQ